MSINVELSEDEYNILRNKIRLEMDRLNEILIKLNEAKASSLKEEHKQNKRLTRINWKSQINEYLHNMDVPLTSDDILNGLSKNNDFQGKTRASLISSISATLSQLKQAGHVTMVEDKSEGLTFWCLPTWVREDGKITDQYIKKLNEFGGFGYALNKIEGFDDLPF